MRIHIEWASEHERQIFSLFTAIAAVFLVCMALVSVRKKGVFRAIFRLFGVGLSRFKKLLYEFRRKAFHLLGLLIPIIYYFGLHFRLPRFIAQIFGRQELYLFTPGRASLIIFILFALDAIFEAVRISDIYGMRAVLNRWLGALLRPSEQAGRPAGSLFFMLGVFLTLALNPPLTAILACVFLTVGDFAAAAIGTVFGRTKIVGKKSLEGSLACLVACFMAGLGAAAFVGSSFGQPLLGPWAAMVLAGAAVTAVVELFSGGLFDDNLTIPPLAALGMTVVARVLQLDLSL
ncbi:hypothetical protein PAPYR_10650 [Paratrimastix pyriformis]|uniref:Phosphatidate cytidylyltransferase n=1 Tax=Paratrimastix pyriformis TaxID=342808 RepID=A0ABQ8U5H9_9EUKA|nr:hypothetical protein PAPYR_10650 [Paratrimastix pyriformis]